VIVPLVLSALALGAGAPDPPLLVPWNRVGDITLGEPRARFEREYGRFHVADAVADYYRLHRSKVFVTFYGGRVGAIGFTTPYYRTTNGFGVGSRIPIGNGHWHGFVWNKRNREKPCHCWTKVGLGKQSLPVTPANFEKPWFFIEMHRGRVSRFYWDLKFVD
jgi:hypothetical protein